MISIIVIRNTKFSELLPDTILQNEVHTIGLNQVVTLYNVKLLFISIQN